MGVWLYVRGYKMKPPKLYIKFFIYFMGILVVTEVLIFLLFKVTGDRSFRERVRQYTLERVVLLKELTEEKLKSGSAGNPAGNVDMQRIIDHIGKISAAKVWVTSHNKALCKSFNNKIPADLANLPDKFLYSYNGIKIYMDFNKAHNNYAISPFKIKGYDDVSFHILFGGRERGTPETGFTLGLAGIGIIIALLVIPISRIITKRVKELRQSAHRIASGDLSYRIDVRGRDEIGELGKAFNQMADKVERMVMGGKALTALVSHELRTPLTRIRIAEEMLREKFEGTSEEEYLRHLDEIGEDIDLLNNLIGRILELSKMDMHESRFEMEQFDVKEMISDLLHQLKPIVERKKLKINTDLIYTPQFKGNYNSLSTALLNVFDNAVKFTEDNGRIYVGMAIPNGRLEISVTNSYKRLDNQDLARIFEPFQRVGDSDASGSGLGLAISQKIIKRHGGSVEAKNSEKGFNIVISLPLGDE